MTVLTAAPPTGGRRRWQAVAGLIATVLYIADVSPVASTIAFAAIGVSTVWACFYGPRRSGAEPRSAWLLIGIASTLFLIGVVIRPWTSSRPLPWPLLSDAATIPG
jgi:hypothetical protein